MLGFRCKLLAEEKEIKVEEDVNVYPRYFECDKKLSLFLCKASYLHCTVVRFQDYKFFVSQFCS